MTSMDNTMTAYKFNQDGISVDVEKEEWCWEAYYNDGTILKQFGDGIFHQFREIDQRKLSIFKMVHNEKHPFTLLFNPDNMKLIHFYKNTRLNMGTDQESTTRTYCFGYEVNTNGRVNKFMLMLLSTGETIMTEDCNLINYK